MEPFTQKIGHPPSATSRRARVIPRRMPPRSRRTKIRRAGCRRDSDHARGKPIELWWQDGARVGQQGSLTYVWAETGSRPRRPRDQRYQWTDIFGAVCPARGVGAALILPHVNIDAMNLYLEEISTQITQGARAVITLDGAGWHQRGDKQKLPDNISLLPLPPHSPELIPQENIWQFLKQNYLADRVYDTYRALVDACCKAWNALIATPDRITSIASRDWQKRSARRALGIRRSVVHPVHVIPGNHDRCDNLRAGQADVLGATADVLHVIEDLPVLILMLDNAGSRGEQGCPA